MELQPSNEKEIRRKRYVNTDTGELTNLPPNAVSVDIMEIVKASRFKGKLKSDEGGYINLMADFESNLRIRFDLTFEDLGRVLFLFTYASYRDYDGKLYLKNHSHKLDKSGIRDALKLNARQTNDFIKRVSEKGLLLADNVGYFFTDDVIVRGKLYGIEKRNKNYYKIYTSPIRDLYEMFAIENKPKSVKPLGVLLSIIPFIKLLEKHDKALERNHSNNVLVVSEYNQVNDMYEPLSQKMLAEKLGISEPTLIKDIGLLNEFVKENTGQYLIYKYKANLTPLGIKDIKFKYTNEAILINPNYVRGTAEDEPQFKRLLDTIQNISRNDNIIYLDEIIK